MTILSRRVLAPWWLRPTALAGGLAGFILYASWSALVAGPAQAGPYLSPFYSPMLGRIGAVSAAVWLLPFPLAFRGTCYYFRRAYHRSLLWDPPACAVAELRRRGYRGETRWPLVLNNLHRYALYAALALLAVLWYEAVASFHYRGRLYVGLGGAVLVVDALLLSAYTFGCHSLRHLVGGRLDGFSTTRRRRLRHRAWRGCSALTAGHGLWGWTSLLGVVIADIYVRLVQSGMPDPHLLG